MLSKFIRFCLSAKSCSTPITAVLFQEWEFFFGLSENARDTSLAQFKDLCIQALPLLEQT
jgi:hypothetical protein